MYENVEASWAIKAKESDMKTAKTANNIVKHLAV